MISSTVAENQDLVQSNSLDSQFAQVDVADLRIGTKLRIPIYDDRDVLLLADGAIVTSRFLQKLKARSISEIKVHHSELHRICAGQPSGSAETALEDRQGFECALRTELSNELDTEIARGALLGLPPQGDAFEKEVQDNGTSSYSAEKFDQFVESNSQAVSQMENVFQNLMSGKGLDVDDRR